MSIKDIITQDDSINQVRDELAFIFSPAFGVRTSSIVDLPREFLPDDVWDLEQKKYTLKVRYQQEIYHRLNKFIEKVLKKPYVDYISGLYIISSVGTYFYNETTDIDIKVILNFDKFRSHFSLLDKFKDEEINLYLVRESRNLDFMTSPLKGGNRPFDWYFYSLVEFMEYSKESHYKFDSIYNIFNSSWLKPPKKMERSNETEILNYATQLASELFKNFDYKLGRLRRESIRYSEFLSYLKKINPKSVKVREELLKTIRSIEELLYILGENKDVIGTLRNNSVKYNYMMNLFSEKFNSSNYNDGNLIRKILEKFGYWLVLVELSDIDIEEEGVTPENIEKIRQILEKV